MDNQTALDWFFDKIKIFYKHDGDLFESVTFAYAIANDKEKMQHKKIITDFVEHLRDNNSIEIHDMIMQDYLKYHT